MENMKKKGIISWKRKVFPYILIAPNSAIFLLFILIPAINGIRYSLSDWEGIGVPEFVGFENYLKAFQDTKFWDSMLNTCIYTIFALPLIIIVPLLLANLMIQEFRGKGLFRAVFYWPSMISYIVVGVSFKFIFGDASGIVNYLLTQLGMGRVDWLTQNGTAMGVVVLATVWSRAGFYMVIFMAGLQSISVSYYEAADVDGANVFQKFFRITLPLIRPTTLFALILGLIDLFKAYGLVISLTGGGPAGATKFIVQYIYERAFSEFNMGYACTLSIILMVVLGIFTGIQFAINKGGRINA